MIIQTRNFLTNEPWVPITRTTHLEVAGTSVLRWENPNGFAASWAIQVGDTGEEQSEVLLLSASTPAGTAGTTTANSLYEHPADTPIYGVKYNQVVFQHHLGGTAVAGTTLADGTVTIAPDGINTIFDHTAGTTGDAYRTFFRNSVTGGTSSLSDWIIPGGYTFYALGRIRERAKERLFSSKFIKSDLTWNDWANEWKDRFINAAIAVNQSYAIGTVDVGFGTNGLGTITTTNFKQVKRVDISYDGFTTQYLSTAVDYSFYPKDQIFLSSHPCHAWRGDNIFQVLPADSGGSARLEFYTFGTTLNNDSDELPGPLRPYTKSFVDYLQANAYAKDGKESMYQSKMAEAISELNNFITEITPRDKTGNTMIKLVEPLSGEDYFY